MPEFGCAFAKWNTNQSKTPLPLPADYKLVCAHGEERELLVINTSAGQVLATWNNTTLAEFDGCKPFVVVSLDDEGDIGF